MTELLLELKEANQQIGRWQMQTRVLNWLTANRRILTPEIIEGLVKEMQSGD